MIFGVKVPNEPKITSREYATFSAKALFWLVLCPHCDFEIRLPDMGYQAVNYNQAILFPCPKCKTEIIKTVGIDLGKLYDRSARVSVQASSTIVEQ